MNKEDISSLMCIFIGILFIQLAILLYTLSFISQANLLNWQECTGTIIASESGTILVSYDVDGKTYYNIKYSSASYSTDTVEYTFKENDNINLYYYKNNPAKVSYNNPQASNILTIVLLLMCILFFMIPAILLYKIIHKPKNGIREYLKMTDDNSFLWEMDGKQKQISSQFRLKTYQDILYDAGIDEVICYMKNKKSNTCYADFNETFEEKNIIVSTSNYLFDI